VRDDLVSDDLWGAQLRCSPDRSNRFGYHVVLNNQYGGAGATAQLCTGYGGVNCVVTIQMNYNANYNLTPINSIVLNRP
jgi:hypothetical protein